VQDDRALAPADDSKTLGPPLLQPPTSPLLQPPQSQAQPLCFDVAWRKVWSCRLCPAAAGLVPPPLHTLLLLLLLLPCPSFVPIGASSSVLKWKRQALTMSAHC